MPVRRAGRSWNLLDAISASAGSTIDSVYAACAYRFGASPPFFKEGWGDLGVVDFHEDARHFESWPPAHFDVKVEWKRLKEGSLRQSGTAWELLQGTFRTPCYGRVYDALPQESRTARVQILRPTNQAEASSCVLHLAATGEHSFKHRLQLGEPLLAQGIASMVLESPFYGQRQPKVQAGSRLQRVSDLLTLGRATLEESLFLLDWAAQQGASRLGACGFSMGGVHASMVASLYPHPIACVPLLAPRSAAVAYCRGALWDATAWKPLTNPTDAKQQDVLTQVLAAAQPNLITAAALRVLQQPHLRTQPAKPPNSPPSSNPRSPTQPGGSPSAHSPSSTSEPAASSSASSSTGQGRSGARGDSGFREGTGSASTDTSSDGRVFSEGSTGAARKGPWLWLRRGGIDVAERLWRDVLKDVRQTSDLEYQHARIRLEQVLETYTDITRFPLPRQPQAAVIVGAKGDRYVDPHSILEMAEHWPGSEVRWVEGGHITAFVLCQPVFRKAITDALSRLKLDSESS